MLSDKSEADKTVLILQNQTATLQIKIFILQIKISRIVPDGFATQRSPLTNFKYIRFCFYELCLWLQVTNLYTHSHQMSTYTPSLMNALEEKV